MLIKVGTGGFDPPPSVIAIPWGDLTITVLAVVAALGTAPMKASPIRMSLPGPLPPSSRRTAGPVRDRLAARPQCAPQPWVRSGS